MTAENRYNITILLPEKEIKNFSDCYVNKQILLLNLKKKGKAYHKSERGNKLFIKDFL